MRHRLLHTFVVLLLSSCMGYGPMEEESFDVGGLPGDGTEVTGLGLFITNEGNFMYGNASLSYYDTRTNHVENEVFARANAQKLGDVAHSMVVRNGIGWVVVNNSGVIFAIDINTFREVGRITGFTSPRCICFLSDDKAYVTQIWDPRIFIVDPHTFEVTGHVMTDMDYETGSTEQMAVWDKYLFTNCWSYNNCILKIDTETDEVVDKLVVGIQPKSLVLDCHGRLWTVTDGGYEGSPYGYEAPVLCCIDPDSFTIVRQYRFRLGDHPSEVTLNGAGDTLYWINDDVWRMSVDDEQLPARPFIESSGTRYYSLTVNPVDGDVYVADALDYAQNGVVLRYTADGELTDSFTVGITPGSFCWR